MTINNKGWPADKQRNNKKGRGRGCVANSKQTRGGGHLISVTSHKKRHYVITVHDNAQFKL